VQPHSNRSSPPTPVISGDPALIERVTKVINLIRPAVQADGGDVELVGITPDQIVRIRLHGACVGCPSSTVTLQMGIERNLKEHVPQIRGVESVD
jgi:Fe-S cluster biogenesis protein NfuA